MVWWVIPKAEASSSCVWPKYSLRKVSNLLSPKFYTFFQEEGRQQRYHCLSSNATHHSTLFHLEPHLHKYFGILDALLSSNERRKSALPANDDQLAHNQTFSHHQKCMMQKQIR